MYAQSEKTPLFTVFTATYNRGGLLDRVYQSLLAQTIQDFEWLVVDDGSTDNTANIVDTMKSEGRLRIRYVYKENGGMQTAYNLGVKLAKGSLFLRLDSDDACLPKAMETLLKAWSTITDVDKGSFSGASCLCQNFQGEVVGDPYPKNHWVSDWATLTRLRGEKWGFHRTDILREFPYPEFEGEKHCPDGLVWGRVHDKFRTLCINEPLRIYFDSPDSITRNVAKILYRCPRGTEMYYREQISRHRGLTALKYSINYTRYNLAKASLVEILRCAPHAPLAYLAAPLGVVLHLRDRAKGLLRP